MKNLSEALKSFREKQSQFCDYWPEEDEFDIHWESIESFLKSTLISLLDEVVMKSNINRNDDEQFKRGWNDCRQELIKKINEIKK